MKVAENCAKSAKLTGFTLSSTCRTLRYFTNSNRRTRRTSLACMI